MIPLCKATLYEQAKARKEKNPEKSERQIAREMAEEIGRPVETVRHGIKREKKKRMGDPHPLPSLNLTESDKSSIKRGKKVGTMFPKKEPTLTEYDKS